MTYVVVQLAVIFGIGSLFGAPGLYIALIVSIAFLIIAYHYNKS